MNRIFEYFSVAFATLWANKARSALTMVGIIIGTSAVIAIFAVGQSAASSIGSLLGSFGNFGLFIVPEAGSRRLVQAQLQWRDLQVLRDQCTRCGRAYAYYDSFFSMRRGHKRDSFELTSDTDHITDSLAMAEGRRFTAGDVDGAKAVTELSWPAKQQLFGDAPALGQTVRIAGRPFTVVGVFADISAGVLGGGIGTSDAQIFIPYTTYHNIPGSQPIGLQVYPAAGSTSAETGDEAVALLKRIHGSKTSYQSIDTSQQAGAFLNVIAFVAIGISAIGGIALVVGGIGVMNIMLVSVMERTREIGIRKAIGASRTDILLQFLSEAVAITLIGGAIGTAIGSLAGVGASSLLITKLSGHAGTIAWLPILGSAVGFSVAIGIFFGTYPAVRASHLSPIDCLRHE